MASYQYSAEYVHHLNHESQEAIPTLFHGEQHWLNVVFEEYSRNGTFTNDGGLLCYSVLIGENDSGGKGSGGVYGVDSRYNGEEVLEFVKVIGSYGNRSIEWVEE